MLELCHPFKKKPRSLNKVTKAIPESVFIAVYRNEFKTYIYIEHLFVQRCNSF